MTTSSQNSVKKSHNLSVEDAKNIVLSVEKEPSQEEIFLEISNEIIEQYRQGVKLKAIAQALKANGYTKISVSVLEKICGVEHPKKVEKPNQNLSEPVEFTSGQIS